MTSKSIPTSLSSKLRQWILMGGRHWWITALIWVAMVAPARAALELRVAIQERVNQIQVASSTQGFVRDGSGRVLAELAPANAFDAKVGPKGVNLFDQWQAKQLWIEPSEGGYVWIGDRWYRGKVLLVATSKGLTAVNYVDLEQYLYSVLGSEMNGNWPQEALKAQAVAARSYALYQRQQSATSLYDVGDTAAWQVYTGLAAESSGTQVAVNSTAGQVLTYKGKIIEAVFHSSAGGYTENAENVWVQALPYLRSVPDFDQGTPNYEWVKTFSGAQLKARITGVGNILSLVPQRVGKSGRIITMKVIGDAGSKILSGSTLRDALDLKSTLFTITPVFDAAANKGNHKSIPSSFQVNGRGFGHGLGLSQWGAYNMAQQGYNYQQIVLHYYKGTALAKIQVK